MEKDLGGALADVVTACKIGPDEVLVIALPEEWDDMSLLDAISRLGLDGRVLVMRGDIQMAKIERGASGAVPGA